MVDADGHVVEPRAAWDAVPEAYRPRIDADAHGFEHVVVGDTEILAVALGTLATPGARFSQPRDIRPLEDAWPGGSDPRARLADMDSEGIDRAVLYPSVGLYFWALDDPVAGACHRPRLQRLAGVVLRGRPAPPVRCGDGAGPGPRRRRRRTAAGLTTSSASRPPSSVPIRAWDAPCRTRPTSRSGRRPRRSA